MAQVMADEEAGARRFRVHIVGAGSLGFRPRLCPFALENFNDDFAALNDVHIWPFAHIRANCQRHSAITHIGQPIVDYDTESGAGGDCNVGLIGPARIFFHFPQVDVFAGKRIAATCR